MRKKEIFTSLFFALQNNPWKNVSSFSPHEFVHGAFPAWRTCTWKQVSHFRRCELTVYWSQSSCWVAKTLQTFYLVELHLDLLCTYMLCVPCGKRRFCTSFSMCPCYLFLQALKTFPSYSNKHIWFFPRQEASNLEKNIPKPLLESFVATHISMKCGRRPKVSLLVCNTHSHEMWQDIQNDMSQPSLKASFFYLEEELKRHATTIPECLLFN